jgi:ribose 5-phosphate isomerase B
LPRNSIGEDEIRSLARKVLDELEPHRGVEPQASSAGTRSIALGADHGGFALKEMLRGYLEERGFMIFDCGTHSTDSVDYPDFAAAVARRVARGESDVGIVVDGAGIGSCMAANKIAGARAAMCYDISSARNSREHNHANVLTLGAGLIGEGLARQIVDAWLETEWGPARHARRVELITALERETSSNG